MHSIRFKITAITVAAILTTFLMLFAVSYSSIHTETVSRSTEIMSLLCQEKTKALDQYFESVEQSVEMAAFFAGDTLDSVILVECGAAGSSAGQTTTAEQRARLNAYLGAYCDSVQEAFASVAGHTLGVVSYYYCIDPAISSTEHGFFCSRIGKTGFTEREALDAGSLDAAGNDWYYLPVERGRPSWVGPYIAERLGGIWVSSYVMPIYKAGALIGVLGMDIPVTALTEQLRSLRVYETGFACLFDEQGRVLYHPLLEIGSEANLPGLSMPVAELLRSSSSDRLVRYSYEGQERQVASTTLSSGMTLFIVAPVREINASWIALSRLLIVLGLGIIALFTVLLSFVMRVIMRPLKGLTDASRQLAAAEYDVALDYHRQDEIGVLTDAFKQMRDKLKLYIEDLNRRLYTDSLTELPNMRGFFRLAEPERARMLAAGERPVTLYVNLIGMKHYNRQYGFEEGDRLICEIGAILKRHFGAGRLCRFSEDHFAALAPEAGLEQELRAVFREAKEANGGRSLPVRVGVYPDGKEPVSVSVACDRAKFACDRRRGSYVSGFCVFDEEMLHQLENVRYIISNFDRALEEHWIKVFYQPIVCSANGCICDEEALSRWYDPVRGLLPPNDFVPILEDAGLIYKLDLYVLDTILEKMLMQRAAGVTVVPHSLNLSRVDFDACDIVEEICRRVDKAGIPREWLTVEVTESMVGRDFNFMKQQIERLQALGFRVWMDDFGSGYSTLGVLQQVHFDLLKFDMRFLDGFGEGEECRIILRQLVQLAIGLGMETVCEGVETPEEAAFLRAIGCTKLQGFYYSSPAPFDGGGDTLPSRRAADRENGRN